VAMRGQKVDIAILSTHKAKNYKLKQFVQIVNRFTGVESRFIMADINVLQFLGANLANLYFLSF